MNIFMIILHMISNINNNSELNMRYTWGQLKADSITGFMNGFTFGLIYSFFTHPFEFDKPEVKQHYEGKRILYYRSWTLRMALAFGILRTTYNMISKQELGPAY